MNHVKNIVVVALLSLLTACGGGGGSGTSSAATTVSGVASKGIIKKGTIKVYPVNATGVKGSTPLALGKTDDNGAYSVNIGSYSGPIVVEASGKYTDEATGNELEVPDLAPLHAALDNVTAGSSISLPVTPLTELAYRQAGASLTKEIIKEKNKLISSLMGFDIINTTPVAPTAAAFASATDQHQKDYALILAAVSQIMATNGSTLESVLADLNSALNSTTAATAIYNALTTYMTNPNNLTGESTIPVTLQALQNKQLTLALSGTNVSAVRTFEATLTLPDGLQLRTDATGFTQPGVFILSGSAVTASNSYFAAHYVAASGSTPATLNFKLFFPNGGLAAGDIATITFDTAGGSTSPVVTADNLTEIDFRDKDGAALSGSDRPVLSLR